MDDTPGKEPAVNDVVMSFTAEQIALGIERQIAEFNEWDMPATLWNVLTEDLPEGMVDFLMAHRDEIPADAVHTFTVENKEPNEVADAMLADGAWGMGFGFLPEFVTELEGHPYDAMVGRAAPPEALGAALCTEGWDYSAEVKQRFANHEEIGFPPSKDPNRREMRMVHLMWRDGTEVMVQRWRDTDEVETHIAADGPEGMSFSGRVPGCLRRYLGRPSGMKYDVSAYDAARRIWVLGLIHTASDLLAGLNTARDMGRDIEAELMEKLVDDGGMPREAAEAFIHNPADGLVLTGIRSEPNSVISRAPFPVGVGLSCVFDDCEALPDYEHDAAWDDYMGLLGGSGPEAGTAEDQAIWERVRLLQLNHLDVIGDTMDLFTAETGQRKVGEIPVVVAKEKLAKDKEKYTWMDAPLFAYTVESALPDEEWLVAELDRMVDENVLTPGTVAAVRSIAGL